MNMPETLTAALPFMLKYQGQTVVIKYGGNAMTDETIKQSVLSDILLLKTMGINVVLVHGGGPAISEMLDKYDMPSKFIGGLRYTDKATAELALAALSGMVNKSLVRDIQRLGGDAIGISGIDGRMIEVEQLSEELGYVGKITKINTEIIERIAKTSAIPVIATAGVDVAGEIYNVNADTAASRIAGELQAERFILLSDVRGLYADYPDESSFLVETSLSKIEHLIAAGKISGGMIPKLEAIQYAMENGLNEAVLLDGRMQHSLILELFTTEGFGTLIKKDDLDLAKFDRLTK
ncbi:acetylglutamate kinase [Lactococcus piscium]|uniref:acetylglutamate kinase n=1 Tax=Pseudolactococcus carnosus TaxID=2749961 RepID=UPI0015DCD349|nr:acetylglutamate kinase [Lactococcus carnosus]MCJ1972394.1 acetylglutamate kinase [Lactococcus carnosus]MCJ1981063.1 acetylglutamate kinase [Lactococcus carnosus]MCJ1987149.1 acetylglutamate kinase [Lactococcus carnosus]MCJ1991599.1 acetylglutamate kinase [Lactococcus carnosus]MCJ2000293.1 acetylglutamate kinase [Lactococcus carnosus]